MSLVLAQLYAIRAQVDAAIVVAETEAGVAARATVEPGSCPKCLAAPDRIEDASTLDGTKRNRCSACGHEWLRESP